VKLQYLVANPSLVILQSSVCTYVRWSGWFNTHTIRHWLLQLPTKFDGNF